jgi:hypothetical protein
MAGQRVAADCGWNFMEEKEPKLPAVRSIAWLDDRSPRIIVARVGEWNPNFARGAGLKPPLG